MRRQPDQGGLRMFWDRQSTVCAIIRRYHVMCDRIYVLQARKVAWRTYYFKKVGCIGKIHLVEKKCMQQSDF